MHFTMNALRNDCCGQLRQAMAERYKKLRLEVQTANDAGQLGCSYTELARRVVRAENKAASAAFAPLARKGAPAAKAGAVPVFLLPCQHCQGRCSPNRFLWSAQALSLQRIQVLPNFSTFACCTEYVHKSPELTCKYVYTPAYTL